MHRTHFYFRIPINLVYDISAAEFHFQRRSSSGVQHLLPNLLKKERKITDNIGMRIDERIFLFPHLARVRHVGEQNPLMRSLIRCSIESIENVTGRRFQARQDEGVVICKREKGGGLEFLSLSGAFFGLPSSQLPFAFSLSFS